MEIHEPSRDLSKPKTIKVRIPKMLHLKLHERKILLGEDIQDTVRNALDHYFEAMNGEAGLD